MPVSVGANQEFVEGEYGGPVDEQSATLVIGPSVSRIVDNNPEAVSFTLLNLGSNNLFVALDDSVSASHGILLVANGGSMSLNVRNDQELPARAWFAIAPKGNTDVFYIRNVRYTLNRVGT